MTGKIEDEDDVVDPAEKMTPKQFNTHLMKVIYDYWAAQGHRVRVWAEPVPTPGRNELWWIIRSDLVDGLPLPKFQQRVDAASTRVLSPPLS